MKHDCKFEEVIPRIERKLDKALEFKYMISGGLIATTFIVGIVWKILELILK